MPTVEQAFTAFVLVIVALIVAIAFKPGPFHARGGKALAFVAFFLLPVVASVSGLAVHVEHSKTTDFCLSCHIMERYGTSLHLADQGHLAAAHFQNARIDREQACFTCHTTYTMFGDYKAKLKGLKHIYMNYIGHAPDKIKLYEAFQNRECLHCHDGARSFETQSDHQDIRGELASNKTSCLECHSPVHDVDHQVGAKLWEEPKR